MGQFVLHFSIAFAELEHDYASLRTKEVMASMRQKRHPRFYDAIGWRHVPGTRGDWHLVPDLQEREVVERIHQMYASGMSQEDISNALTNERIVRRNGRWFPVVIRRALAAREQG